MLTTEDGLGIPEASAELEDYGRFAGPAFGASQRTAADGGFVLRFESGSRPKLVVWADGYASYAIYGTPWKSETEPKAVHLQRRRVVAGAVPRDKDGTCKTSAIVRDAPAEQYLQVPPSCRFSFDLSPEVVNVRSEHLDWQVTVSFDRSPTSGACGQSGSSPDLPGDPKSRVLCNVTGDVLDLCLGADCGPQPALAWLFVRVVGPDRNLIANARVQAFADGRTVASCTAPSGACFLHDLPAHRTLVLDVDTPMGKTTQITLTPAAGMVTETSVNVTR